MNIFMFVYLQKQSIQYIHKRKFDNFLSLFSIVKNYFSIICTVVIIYIIFTYFQYSVLYT